MSSLIGREREIATGLDLFQTAVTTPVPRVLLVEGPSGIGKSAFMAELGQQLQDRGALVVGTVAYRIQATVPYASISRLLAQIANVLGADASRYLGGDGVDGDPALALSTALEGIMLDRPVAILLDDAQWADEETLTALEAILPQFARSPLLLVFARRIDEAFFDLPVAPDETIGLGTLDARRARQLVEAHVPNAPGDVIERIVEHAEGMPIDLTALAEAAAEIDAHSADDVEKSTRSVIARRIQGLSSGFRTFLQIVSLLPEPIEYDLLTRLWTDETELQEYIAQASARYLVQEGPTLRFRHALVGEAVLETIPIKIPLHRRIIEAISKTGRLRIEDRLLIAEQALSAGDRKLAQEAYLALALQANEKNLFRMVISASERHMDLGEPADETLLQFYGNFAKALSFIAMDRRAETVLLHALSEAQYRNLSHLGTLAAQLVLSQFFGDRYESAKLTYRHYAAMFTDPLDLAMLHGAALWFNVCEHDAVGLRRTLAHIEALNIEVPAPVRMRMEIAQAFIESRSGNYEAARKRLPVISDLAKSLHSTNSNHPLVVDAYIRYMQFGTRENAFVRLHENDARNPEFTQFVLHSKIYEGRIDEASLSIEDSLRRPLEGSERGRILGSAAALYALRGAPGSHWKTIETESLRFAAGEKSAVLYNMAVWSAASGLLDDATSSRLLDAALPYAASAQDPYLFQWRLPVVLAAQRLKRKDVLARAADGTAFWPDMQALSVAECGVSTALAEHFLGRPPSGPLTALAAQCELLGMTLARLLLLAACSRGTEQKEAAKELAVRGITWFQAKTSLGETKTPGSLTARERQIADLISMGKTNKEIAEQLVLSERTIEGHVANIFNKLGVSKRTQIATWVLGQATVVR